MILIEFAHYLLSESSAIIGAGLGGLAMVAVRKGWDIYKDYSKRKKNEAIPRLLDADLAVYQTLSQLLIETGADRAYVMQFHNGVYYINQGNHMKVSCTHETVKEGIARVQDTMQEVLLSKFAGPMTEVLKQRVAIFDTDNQPDSYYKNLIKSHGTSRSVAGIMMEGNVVEGALVINYLDGSEVIKKQNISDIKQRVIEAADIIGFKLREKR
jgi:hypothetical protein